MGLLSHMVIGAAKGGLKAHNENQKQEVEDRRWAEKQAVLELREQNLLKLQNQYAQGRQDKQNEFTVKQQGSGFYRDGKELTKSDYSALDESGRQGLLSTADYGKKQADYEHKNAMELQMLKNSGKTGGKLTSSDLKYMKEEAFNSLSAQLGAIGAKFDMEGETVTIPTDERGFPDHKALQILKKSGFEYAPGARSKTDKDGLFTGDNHYITVHLGRFNPNKFQSKPHENTDGESGSAFDTLLAQIGGNGDDTTRQPHVETVPVKSPKDGILAKGWDDRKGEYGNDGEGAPQVNPELPEDPKQWNIKRNAAGAPVAIVNGKEIPLSEQELEMYYANRSQGMLDSFTNWAGRNLPKNKE